MQKLLKITLFNLLLFLVIIFLPRGQWEIDIRFALFNTFTDNLDIFEHTPSMLAAQSEKPKFRHFKQKYIDDLLATNPIQPLKLNDNIEPVDKAKKIVNTFSKNGGEGCGNYSGDLVKNIKWLSQDDGHGCCSDHSQVFIATCLVNKLFAREVHHAAHTFNEFFDEKNQKWVWIDAQYCLLAKDSTNNSYLSIAEIKRYFDKNKPIQWEYFGGKEHKLYDAQKRKTLMDMYYTKESFEIILMTFGNNVYEVDFYNQKLRLLPKKIQQIILLSTGIQPGYIIFDPENQKKDYLKTLKYLFYSLLCLWLYFNFYIIFKTSK